MATCPNCQAEVISDAQFCEACGYRLAGGEQGTVEVRESLGSEVMLHLSVSAVGLEVTSDGVSAKEPAWLISRNEARTAAEVGDAVAVTADPAEMHFFDRESGAAISA